MFYFDYALVVAKNLRNNVVIQTASSSEAEMLSAKEIIESYIGLGWKGP